MTKIIDRSDVKALTEIRRRPLLALLSGNAPEEGGTYLDTLIPTEEAWAGYDNDPRQILKEQDYGIPRDRAFEIHQGSRNRYNVVTLFPEGHHLHVQYLERVAKRAAREAAGS